MTLSEQISALANSSKLRSALTSVAPAPRLTIVDQITGGLQQGANILTTYYQGREQANAAAAAAAAAAAGTQGYYLPGAGSSTTVTTDGGSSLLIPLMLTGLGVFVLMSMNRR